ncbi:hypothetical protein BESB_000110 [Besnoitia besnoiti]|uniref:Uncharacterized protein n=1 Tax=Besnoitia besnoiti TaxID=94643 RepID=A0A2A9MID9_BESBE|nr:hypothetical protein BESB_000110 [Besnoitia besnoiti]PFH37669.1 hypothetical protein BESB_000110 [Besnoitia besnoiti]
MFVSGQAAPPSASGPPQRMWNDPTHAALALLAQNPNLYSAAAAYVVRPIVSTAIHGASNAVRGAVNRVSNALGAAAAASAMTTPYGYYGDPSLSVAGYPQAHPSYSGLPAGAYPVPNPPLSSGNDYYLSGMAQPYASPAAYTFVHGGQTGYPYPVYTAPSLLAEVANQTAGSVAGVAGMATNAVRSVAGIASQAAQTATQGLMTGLQTRPQIPWNEALSIAERFVVPSIEAIAKAAPAVAPRTPPPGTDDQNSKRLRRGDKGQDSQPDDPNAPPHGAVPEKRPRLYVSQAGNVPAVK